MPECSYSASSSLNETTLPHHSRFLDKTAIGWFSAALDSNARDEWIQVDFLQPKIIREFLLDAIGYLDAYIKNFEVHASLDGVVYSEYKETKKYVLGGVDKRRFLLDTMIFCRFFKLVSVESVSHIATRWEFVQADSKFPALFCTSCIRRARGGGDDVNQGL